MIGAPSSKNREFARSPSSHNSNTASVVLLTVKVFNNSSTVSHSVSLGLESRMSVKETDVA